MESRWRRWTSSPMSSASGRGGIETAISPRRPLPLPLRRKEDTSTPERARRYPIPDQDRMDQPTRSAGIPRSLVLSFRERDQYSEEVREERRPPPRALPGPAFFALPVARGEPRSSIPRLHLDGGDDRRGDHRSDGSARRLFF